MPQHIPVNEGVTSIEVIHDQLLRPGKPTRGLLSEMLVDGIFFTHAPLLGYGGLGSIDVDPVRDYFIKNEIEDDAPTLIELNGLVIANVAGPGFEDWDNRLLWVMNEHAAGLFLHLRGTAIVDRDAKRFGAVHVQIVDVPDQSLPISRSIAYRGMFVPVVVFSYDGNDRMIWFCPGTYTRFEGREPGAVISPGSKEMIAMAEAYFATGDGPAALLHEETQ